jgi:hypothetical protein
MARCATIGAVDRTVLWKAALTQLVAVAALSVVLAILLPHSFFDAWGWVAGPAAWVVCSLITARVLALPSVPVLIGAAIAGVVSVVFVLVGLHWLGALSAIAVFAVWCARLARERGLAARAV